MLQLAKYATAGQYVESINGRFALFWTCGLLRQKSG